MSAPNLSGDEAVILRTLRRLSPDGRRAARAACRALAALGEAQELAQEAAALVPQWGPMIAECMREEADRLTAPASRKEGAE